MTVGIYIRVSTEEQAKEGYSISAQREKLKAYCEIQDWHDYRFYVDEGISAKDMNRPQLLQMIQHIKEGLIDTVLVYRLDRLTRSVMDLYKLLEIFEKYNCTFKSATEVYDTSTAIGRLFITLVAAMAQWERENMGERIRLGFQEKVRQGKYAQNQRPFGYFLDRKTGKLTINEEEAKIVRLIVDLYLKKGYGANRICKYLNERNIKTRDGNAWNDKPLMQLLKNPLYTGTIRWGLDYEKPMLVEGAVPAIIDKQTFEEIQRTIEKRRGLSPRSVASDYIFSGVFKCSVCGHPMVGFMTYQTLATGERVTYKNYRCLRKKTGECKGIKNVSERKLEKAFLDYLKKIDFSPVLEETAASGEEKLNKTDHIDIEELKKELDKIEKRKKKWQYAWANEMMSDDEFRERMNEERELEAKIKKQLEEFDVPQEITTDKIELYSVLQDMERNWSKLSTSEKKSLVQLVVKQIHVAFNEKGEVYIDHIDFY